MDIENNVQEQDKTNYEEIRRQKMKENQKLLKELGLLSEDGLNTANNILSDLPSTPTAESVKKRPKYNSSKIIVKAPNRVSKRIRGEAPEDNIDLEEILDHRDRIIQASQSKFTELKEQDHTPLPKNISVPLTLTSIGTTIWEMGKIYTGKNRSKYWSNHACRYKHPYPIGYRATKSHFGNNYTMTISEGPDGEGPIFSVQVNNSNHIFKGSTPTAPWTTACIKSKSQGTRVSGPLFYGFSDLITMKLIEELDDYDKSKDPEPTEELSNDSKTNGNRIKRNRID